MCTLLPVWVLRVLWVFSPSVATRFPGEAEQDVASAAARSCLVRLSPDVCVIHYRLLVRENGRHECQRQSLRVWREVLGGRAG